jgi:hypothetical protein
MTEQEWLECTDPTPMLRFLKGKASQRKLRLFACGSSRRVWHLLETDASRAAIIAAEQFADGVISDAALAAAYSAAYDAHVRLSLARLRDEFGRRRNPDDPLVRATQQRLNAAWAAACTAYRDVTGVASSASFCTGMALTPEFCPYVKTVRHERKLMQAWAPPDAHSLRCIFGNPFRSIIRIAGWLTSTVTGLAESIYEERAFDRLPILADALEDAGCTAEDILNHCRQPGVHVRGCWPLDLILRKA